MKAALIINISDQSHSHNNGAAGNWIIPAKTEKEDFALLVVYPVNEIQDIGNNRTTSTTIEGTRLAKDIVGRGSDGGSKEKWGVMVCSAEPKIPDALEDAMKEEREYLSKHKPQSKMVKDEESGALVAENVEKESVSAQKVELSLKVQELRWQFEKDCRKHVTPKELQAAKTAFISECQRLVAEADSMWQRPNEKINVTIRHQRAAGVLRQEREWAYSPKQLVGCPGCGAMITENILTCPACAGWLAEGIEELRGMKPKDRALLMYPDRFAEPVGHDGKKK